MSDHTVGLQLGMLDGYPVRLVLTMDDGYELDVPQALVWRGEEGIKVDAARARAAVDRYLSLMKPRPCDCRCVCRRGRY